MCRILDFHVQRLAHAGLQQSRSARNATFTGLLHRFSIPIQWRWCSTKYVQAAEIAACRTVASVSFAETCWPTLSAPKAQRPGSTRFLSSTQSMSEPFEYAGFWLRVWAGAIDVLDRVRGRSPADRHHRFRPEPLRTFLRILGLRFEGRGRDGLHHHPRGRVVALSRFHRARRGARRSANA